jgi:excisionase family DNA binding protein
MKNTLNLLTIDEVADLLKVSKVQLWKLRRDRKIRFVKVGNKAVFRREDIERFISQNLQEARP